MSSELNAPLTEEELAELDNFLLAKEGEQEVMPIDELHGYLTALVVSCNAADENEWFPVILGEEPGFADADEQEKITNRLLRMRNEIASTLESGSVYEPLIIEEEYEGEVVEAFEGWCLGFVHAVADYQESWDNLAKNEQELLTPIAKIALQLSEEEPDMDDEEYEACIELLPGAVVGLYAYWHDAA